MKVVINKCYGGFGLSHAAVMRYGELKGMTLYPEKHPTYPSLTTYWTVPPESRLAPLSNGAFYAATQEERIESNRKYSQQTLDERVIARDDPALVQVVEELGKKASGRCASLQVVEVPDDVSWEIDEYDGMEHVAESHRTWG